MNKLFSFLIFISLNVYAQAPRTTNPAAHFTDPTQVKFSGESLMIVTHASNQWDSMEHAQYGINFNVMAARQVQRLPIIYLQDSTDSSSYYYSDFTPDAYVKSLGGEFTFRMDATTVYTQGGYMEQCQSHTVSDVLAQWQDKRFRNSDLKLVYFSDGIYGDFDWMKQGDPKTQKLIDYKAVSGSNVITLAEYMRLFKSPEERSYFAYEYFGNPTGPGVGPWLIEAFKDRNIFVTYGAGRPGRDEVIFNKMPTDTHSAHLLTIQIIEGGSTTISNGRP